MADKKTAVIQALKNLSEPVSATALANAAGFSKASAIAEVLSELVDSGEAVITNSGRFDTYSYGKKSVAKKESAKVEKTEEKVTMIADEKVAEKLPEAVVDGYQIASIMYEGKKMKKITTPDGKKMRLEDDQKLLVINGEPKFLVKSAEDVITCIRKYANDNNMNVFTVEDMKQNKKISDDKDVTVKDNHIMMLSIRKHNKAA